jgi:hypothetical protein
MKRRADFPSVLFPSERRAGRKTVVDGPLWGAGNQTTSLGGEIQP